MYEIKRIRKKGQEALQGFCLQDLEEGSMVGQGLWQNYRKTDEGVPLEFPDLSAAGRDRNREASVQHPPGRGQPGGLRLHELQHGQRRQQGECPDEFRPDCPSAWLRDRRHDSLPPDPYHQHPPDDGGGQGKGILRERDYQDVDGMVTDVPGLVLVTFYADCVPLYFVDPVHRAIGLAHSGWRGTAGRMGERMVEAMGRQFGSRPEDIRAAIGPSICRDCYEVSEDVAAQFMEMLGGDVAVPGEKAGKYQLDLWLANELILRQAGILPEHLEVTDICTCHNSGYLFSHRASGGWRGSLGAFLMLKP